MMLLVGFVFLLSLVDISSSQPYEYPETVVVRQSYPYWLQSYRNPMDIVTPTSQNERKYLFSPTKIPPNLLGKVMHLFKRFILFILRKLKNLLFHSGTNRVFSSLF